MFSPEYKYNYPEKMAALQDVCVAQLYLWDACITADP